MRKGVLLSMVCLCLGCSIKTPEITLTGEKTALENQILGSFEQLATQNLLTTSSRIASDRSVGEQDESVFQAMQNQKFNKDEIDELKRDKVIGENNRGYLEILGNDQYDKDPIYKKIVDQLVADENRDRHIIYQRLAAVNTDAASATSAQQGATFAKMQIEKALPGTMIQLENGQWMEKPKEK
mgnify:CR=1 FL=1